MAAGRPKSIDNTKVFDVARPGKSKPVSTSRPVIVNHSMAVKDPTVVTVTDENSTPMSSPSASRKVINPITISSSDSATPVVKSTITILKEPEEQDAATLPAAKPESPKTKPTAISIAEPEETEVATEEVDDLPDATVNEPEAEVTATPEAETAPLVDKPTAVEEPVAEEADADSAPEATDTPTEEAAPEDTAVEPSEEPKPEAEAEPEAAPAPETSSNAVESSDSASVDAVVGSAGTGENPTTMQKEEADKIARDAELQKLIDSKKYIVPLAHDSTQTTSHKGAVIALIVILLLLIGAYVAVDAKLLTVNVDLPYHFFKQ